MTQIATRLAVLLLCALSAAVQRASPNRYATEPGPRIAGRVVDPHQLRPEDAVVMLGREDSGGFGRTPVPLAAEGTFVTPRLRPGLYILEVVRNPHSPTKPARVVGFNIVTVETADVSGLTVAIRRDTALTGRFRMESDNPRAEWPPHIAVNAFLALDGKPMLTGTVADGAPGGKFVLRSAFGPRVLRCGYTLAPGSKWWPSQVILDGVDITNVPTDFSEHQGGQLEVVFTQHPARIAGVVTDAQGQPVRAPWVLVVSADPSLWQEWATTSNVTQGDTQGRFSLPSLPGKYLVRAVPQGTFDSWTAARRRIQEFASEGAPVEVDARKVSTVALTIKAP
jgi:hypothetical protein